MTKDELVKLAFDVPDGIKCRLVLMPENGQDATDLMQKLGSGGYNVVLERTAYCDWDVVVTDKNGST